MDFGNVFGVCEATMPHLEERKKQLLAEHRREAKRCIQTRRTADAYCSSVLMIIKLITQTAQRQDTATSSSQLANGIIYVRKTWFILILCPRARSQNQTVCFGDFYRRRDAGAGLMPLKIAATSVESVSTWQDQHLTPYERASKLINRRTLAANTQNLMGFTLAGSNPAGDANEVGLVREEVWDEKTRSSRGHGAREGTRHERTRRRTSRETCEKANERERESTCTRECNLAGCASYIEAREGSRRSEGAEWQVVTRHYRLHIIINGEDVK